MIHHPRAIARWLRFLLGGTLYLHAAAAPADDSQRLPDLVVTPTRTERSAFDLPAAVNAVYIGPDADVAAVNLSELLASVPGLVIRDRQNYAQDQQIAIRGFGARSTFGVRGVRLYTDGIPASLPDGQGQTSHFPLSSTERIEVLRGPFSALYGNSSGGVIQTFTADRAPPQMRAKLGGGSYGTQRVEVAARDTRGAFDYNLAADYFGTDGYRRHSEAERYIGSLQLGYTLPAGGRVKFLGSGFALPEAQDPQGLTAAQAAADPRQAAPSAEQFNTRKRVQQYQGGLTFDQPLGERSTLRLMGYGGTRDVLQFLSVPAGAQADARSSGGVVDLDNTYGGGDARWSLNTGGERPFEFTTGVSYDRLNQHRRGYENFSGAQLGVQGAQRRDEYNVVSSTDEYVQTDWRFASRWSATAGVRHSEVRFESSDRYIAPGNPDDSGQRTYTVTAPVAGLLFRASEKWNWYAAYGAGFETPTFNELAYRPDGSGGLNLALEAARSNHYEVGAKHRPDGGGALELALFEAGTRDELAVFGSAGGRTSFHNVGNARRRGVELGWRQPLTQRWSAIAAYTWLQAQFRSSFSNCAPPAICPVAAGTPIPGVPKSDGYAELRWSAPSGWHAGGNLHAVSRVTATDNASQSAHGYAVLGGNLGYISTGESPRWSGFVRANNLLDTRYTGSVIVNESNGRYFEPAAGRNFFAGVTVTFE